MKLLNSPPLSYKRSYKPYVNERAQVCPIKPSLQIGGGPTVTHGQVFS